MEEGTAILLDRNVTAQNELRKKAKELLLDFQRDQTKRSLRMQALSSSLFL